MAGDGVVSLFSFGDGVDAHLSRGPIKREGTGLWAGAGRGNLAGSP